MKNITASEIAELRAKTGLPVMEIKSALVEADGDGKKVLEILKEKSLSKLGKRAGRETKAGVIDSYIHGGRIGVLVEVLSETDFVARSDDFKTFAHEISLQIAAANPKYVSREDVPTEIVKKEKEAFAVEAKAVGKPEDVIEKIVTGKTETYFSETCLLNQPYFRDPEKRISDLLNEIIAKTGEKIVISKFARFELSC